MPTIKQLREKKGLTQEQLAQRTGVTHTSINRYENGRTRPIAVVRQSLARVLGVKPDEIENVERRG